MGIPLIFDCDPTIFRAYKDVDDSLALGYLIRRFLAEDEKYRLIGVTTVFGNASVDETFQAAKQIIEVARVDIPVLRGAESKKMLGKETDASRFIIEKAKEYGEISILATAPLTNIATALLAYPELVDAVRGIVIMGGAVFTIGNVPFAPRAEFNFWRDPVAARLVIRRFRNIVLVPLDLTKKVYWTVKTIRLLEAKKDPLAMFLARAARPWAIVWSRLSKGFNPHDVLAAVYLRRPEIYAGKRVKLDIVSKGLDAGRSIISVKGNDVDVLLKVRREDFLAEYLSAFS